MKALDLFRKYGVVAILILLIIIFTATNLVFLTVTNIINLAKQVAVMAILAVGMTFVLLTGGIELSMGSVVSLVCVVVSMFVVNNNMPAPLAMLCGIVIAAFIGFINGLIIAKIKLPPLIMTLGMQIFLSGFTYTICGGLPVYGVPDSLKWLGQTYIATYLPVSALIMIIALVFGIFILAKTYTGRYFYAIGSNEETANLSGINVDKIRVLAYTLCGVLVGIAGIVMLGRIGSGQPGAGDSAEMDVLTACVLGGVSLNGGKGKVGKAFVGVLIIGVLSNGMSLIGMGSFAQRMVKGFVLIVAVIIDCLQYVKVRKKVKVIA